MSDLKSDTIRLTLWHIASRAWKAALIPLDAGERRFRGGMLGYTPRPMSTRAGSGDSLVRRALPVYIALALALLTAVSILLLTRYATCC